MKRTIPLLITALGGFVLIVAFFIPETEDWGELAAIWFDILASIAFILGGGNLLKVHLKKISDRKAGWGYSGVTILAFLVVLTVGLAKWGSHPAAEQQFFGETFVPLPLGSLPESQITKMDGAIPEKADGGALPQSVRRQLSEENGQILFRGWMDENQKQDLIGYQDELEWQCRVEKLFEQAQPPKPLQGVVAYYSDHQALGFTGVMQPEQKQALLDMQGDDAWTEAIEQISTRSQAVSRVAVDRLPDGIQIPSSLEKVVSYDEAGGELRIKGPMSVDQRDSLANQFPAAKPIVGDRRQSFLQEIERDGEALTASQRTVFNIRLDGLWTVKQLRAELDAAGKAQEISKTACEMLEEQKIGFRVIEPKKKAGEDVSLNDAQIKLLEQFVNDAEMTPGQLTEQLKAAGTFTGPQQAALTGFLAKNPTVGDFQKSLCFALLRAGPLAKPQREFLLESIRAQRAWRSTVGALFVRAHKPLYAWSGDYAEQGNPFWWMYEYAFKPLTATMFAMLAFYIASAAFRAFRAKNVEAILLLVTAFIILLGRTFAGTALTAWLPDSLAGLKLENLTVFIMSVFNTAGNRAIMIGIALGIASTSLKVLLGVDRSYLGSREE